MAHIAVPEVPHCFVREITVREVREWLLEAERVSESDAVADALFEEFSLWELARFVTWEGAPEAAACNPEHFSHLTLTQVRAIYLAAKAANPDFFGFRGRLLAQAERLRAAAPASASTASFSP